MNDHFITDAFKNMMAAKIFGGEQLTVIIHQGNPGPTGRNPDGSIKNYTAGRFNMDPEDWEIVGDTVGRVQNNSDMNGGILASGPVTATHASLWRANNEYLGYIKLYRSIRIRNGDSIRISRGFIRYKFG